MSGFEDDEVDGETFNLLRQYLGLKISESQDQAPETGVLKDARRIYEDAVDVAIDYAGTTAAARLILEQMKAKNYSLKTWSTHDLHPKDRNEATVNFIFTLDLLNFCFWSDELDRIFTIEYKGKKYTGYWSLVAALQRALAEGTEKRVLSSLSDILLQVSPSQPHVSGKMKKSSPMSCSIMFSDLVMEPVYP